MKDMLNKIKECYTQNPKRFWISAISTVVFIGAVIYLIKRKKHK